MKNILALILVGIMVFSLAACSGGSSGGSGGKETEAPQTEAPETDAPETEAAKEEVFDTGEITVTVPEGWTAFVQRDVSAEKDKDGNYPIDPLSLYLIKGGETEMDAFRKPCIYIYGLDSSAETQFEMGDMFYDEVEPFEISILGTKCLAFHAKSDISEDGSNVYEYDVIFRPISDNTCIQYQMITKCKEFDGVTATDPEVMAIMESTTWK